MKRVIQFFCVFLFFCCSVAHSADYQDLFVQYGYKNTLILKTEDKLMQMDCVSAHMQMKQQVDSVRFVFKGTGIEDLWKAAKGTSGNIASAVIEFVFSDGTCIKHPINSVENQGYFTTITKDFIPKTKDKTTLDQFILKIKEEETLKQFILKIKNETIQDQFKNYFPTYKAGDLKRVFDRDNIGNFTAFYPDTEVQIVSYLFFKDLYYQKLFLTLKKRCHLIKERLFSFMDECSENKKLNKSAELRKDIASIHKIQKDIMPLLQEVRTLKQSVDSLNNAVKDLQSTNWDQVKNLLLFIRRKMVENIEEDFFMPLVSRDVSAVALHIHTELDPCEKCRHLLSNLSVQMNQRQCDPGIFLKGFSMPLPTAKFITIVSSSRAYSDNDARIQLHPYDGGIINSPGSPSCIFMPIDHLQFSTSMLPPP